MRQKHVDCILFAGIFVLMALAALTPVLFYEFFGKDRENGMTALTHDLIPDTDHGTPANAGRQ